MAGKNKIIAKARNWLAIHAWNRKSAGSMGDSKKENSKEACREDLPEDDDTHQLFVLQCHTDDATLIEEIKLNLNKKQIAAVLNSIKMNKNNSGSIEAAQIKSILNIDVANKDFNWSILIHKI